MPDVSHSRPLYAIGEVSIRSTARGALALIGALILALGLATTARAQAQPDAYRLGAQDRIAVRVVAWNPIQLNFVRYGEIEGEYSIGSDGRVMLPLIGAIPAANRTPEELAAEITALLQSSIGLAEPPSTAIEIVQYRSIYVLGDVQRPGAYEYRPGLRADQAVALAGGFYRPENGGGSELRDAIRSTGNLRELRVDTARTAIRAARLEAEMDGADSFAMPESLSHPDGPEALMALYLREVSLFDSRRQSLDRAIASLDVSLDLLNTEVDALEEKMVGLDRQVDLVTQAVGNMETLLERGLARSPNLLALQRQQIDLQARQLDTETALFRARQQIAERDRDRIELEARRRQEGLGDLQTARSDLSRFRVRETVLRQILAETGIDVLAPGLDDEPALTPTYALTRTGDPAATLQSAAQDTVLMPLDVLEVELQAVDPARPATAQAGTAAGAGAMNPTDLN